MIYQYYEPSQFTPQISESEFRRNNPNVFRDLDSNGYDATLYKLVTVGSTDLDSASVALGTGHMNIRYGCANSDTYAFDVIADYQGRPRGMKMLFVPGGQPNSAERRDAIVDKLNTQMKGGKTYGEVMGIIGVANKEPDWVEITSGTIEPLVVVYDFPYGKDKVVATEAEKQVLGSTWTATKRFAFTVKARICSFACGTNLAVDGPLMMCSSPTSQEDPPGSGTSCLMEFVSAACWHWSGNVASNDILIIATNLGGSFLSYPRKDYIGSNRYQITNVVIDAGQFLTTQDSQEGIYLRN